MKLLSTHLKEIFGSLLNDMEAKTHEVYGVSLFVFSQHHDRPMSYISNIDVNDFIPAIEQWIDYRRQSDANIPAHAPAEERFKHQFDAILGLVASEPMSDQEKIEMLTYGLLHTLRHIHEITGDMDDLKARLNPLIHEIFDND